MKSALNEYLDGDITAIDLIRTLSGAFDPRDAVSVLAMICAICRVEQGDLDKEVFRSLLLQMPRVPGCSRKFSPLKRDADGSLEGVYKGGTK